MNLSRAGNSKSVLAGGPALNAYGSLRTLGNSDSNGDLDMYYRNQGARSALGTSPKLTMSDNKF